MQKNTKNNKASDSSDYTERFFLINGKNIRTIFPKKTDQQTMSLIKNMLLDSYVKKSEIL
jgi:hypothetical protein